MEINGEIPSFSGYKDYKPVERTEDQQWGEKRSMSVASKLQILEILIAENSYSRW